MTTATETTATSVETPFAHFKELNMSATRVHAAIDRHDKGGSKLLRHFRKREKSGKWNKQDEKKIDQFLDKFFETSEVPFFRPAYGYLMLKYHLVRVRRLRWELQRFRKGQFWCRDVLHSMYWLPLNQKPLPKFEELLVIGETFFPENLKKRVIRPFHVKVIAYQKRLLAELEKLQRKSSAELPSFAHPQRLVREAVALCRASETSPSHYDASNYILPPNAFNGTPYNLEYYFDSHWKAAEIEELFGEAAGILDSGFFVADYEEIIKDGDWDKTRLVTVFVKAKKLKRKFDWVAVVKPERTFEQVWLPEKTKADLTSLVERYRKKSEEKKRDGLTFLFRGAPGTGKSLCAEAIGSALGMSLLRVNFSAVEPEKISNLVTFFAMRAERTGVVLVFEECENIFRTNLFRGTSDGWAKVLFEKFKGVAVFTTNYDLGYGMARRMTYVHEFEAESPELRKTILSQELETFGKSEGWEAQLDTKALLDIVIRHEVPGGYYSSILKVASAISPTGQLTKPALEHAFEQRAKVLDAGKSGIETPKVSLSDVVMKPDQKALVHRIIELARSNRSKHPLLPKGISAIFYGPPGTGKTLVAEAIAHELEKRIYRATAADLLSMYVGESEKAIRRIFKGAEEEGHVLFIDEAEGIFRDRKTAVRSWELTQVNELLRQFDDFAGVVLLASNHKEDMDHAFARRIQFHVEFPVPDSLERVELWRRFLKLTNFDATEGDLSLLAEGFSLSGGEIRNAVIQAQAHGVQDFFKLCEICRVVEQQRFGRVARKVGFGKV